MTPIALMRHYPTAWNAEARLQGRADIPLTDAARAALAGLKMPAPWDRARLVASPLARAAETARLLAGGREVLLEARLVELSWGAWEGCRSAELMDEPGSGFRPTHLWTENERAPGGESLAEAWARVRPALAEIARAGDAAAIVTHKAMMRLILRRAGLAEPEIKRGRLYPLFLGEDGAPRDPGTPVRLEAR